jgi:hypothetical protein
MLEQNFKNCLEVTMKLLRTDRAAMEMIYEGCIAIGMNRAAAACAMRDCLDTYLFGVKLKARKKILLNLADQVIKDNFDWAHDELERNRGKDGFLDDDLDEDCMRR